TANIGGRFEANDALINGARYRRRHTRSQRSLAATDIPGKKNQRQRRPGDIKNAETLGGVLVGPCFHTLAVENKCELVGQRFFVSIDAEKCIVLLQPFPR